MIRFAIEFFAFILFGMALIGVLIAFT